MKLTIVKQLVKNSSIFILIVFLCSRLYVYFSPTNIINTYVQQNRSYSSTIIAFSYQIFIFFRFLIVGIFLLRSGNNAILLIIFVGLTFGVSYNSLLKTQVQIHNLKDKFLNGNTSKKQLSQYINHQHFSATRGKPEGFPQWVGWKFLKSQNYEQQVRNRMQSLLVGGRLGMQDQLGRQFSDAVDSIYIMNSWISDHMLIIDLLELIFRTFGLLVFLVILKFLLIFHFVSSASIKKIIYTFFYLICVVIGTIFYLLLIMIHSVSLQNRHELCLPKQTSGKVNLIINKVSIVNLRQVLNPLIDYYDIYANICETLPPFYKSSMQIHIALETNVICIVFFGCLLTILFLCWNINYQQKQDTQYQAIDQGQEE